MIFTTKLRQSLLQGVAFLTLFFIFICLTILSAPRAYAEPTSAGGTELDWTTSGEMDCDWKNSSVIVCESYAFAFNLPASQSAGYAIYQLVPVGAGGENLGMNNLANGVKWYLHFSDNLSGKAYISKNEAQAGNITTDTITSDNQAMKKLLLASGGSDANNPGGTDTVDAADITKDGNAGLFKDENGNGRYAICGLYTENGHTCFSMLGTTHGMNAPFNKITSNDSGNKVTALREALFTGMDSRDNCRDDAGSLGFILCPILEASNATVQKMIGSDGTGRGFLVELLTMQPLERQNGGQDTDIYKTWSALRDVALGIYVLLFVLIIFGNGIGYDPYTIKRALPRLAVGALLTWASFFIMQTLVDLSNLVGTAVPALISGVTNNTGIKTFDMNMDFAASGLTVVLAIILALVALGALLIGIAGLLARAIIIYALVLIAPLAFAAWVLPNTEGMFKKWWKNLIKVLTMFPIVTGMLAISLLFQAAIGEGSSTPLKIAGSLAPLIAIIMIPKTFKWGGEAFAAAAGFMAAKATQGKDWGKNQGRDRVGKSMREGYGATALNKLGQRKNAAGELVNRPILSRIPGIGSPTSGRKAAVRMGQRQARIDKRYKEGLEGISNDNLANIYDNMSSRQKKSGYGTAVARELGKRRNGMVDDYAKAMRDGDSPEAARIRARITDLDTRLDRAGVGAPGGSSSHAADTVNRLFNIDSHYGGGTGGGGAGGGTGGGAGGGTGGGAGGGTGGGAGGGAGGGTGGGFWGRRGRGSRGQSGSIPNPLGFNPSSRTSQPPSTNPGQIPPPGPQPQSTKQAPPPPPPSGSVPTYTTPAGAPRYTTSGTPIPPPPPPGSVPRYTSNGVPISPPPPHPSNATATGSTDSTPTSPANSTVINNVTNNNSTTNTTTNNNAVKTVLNNNGVPSSIALGAAAQLGSMKKRFGEGSTEHSGLAGIEAKLNQLGRMIQSGSLSQTRLRDNIRDIHRDIDDLPPGAQSEQVNLRGVLSNIERNATDEEA